MFCQFNADEARFVLKDVKAEEQYGFTLSKSLLRAGEGKVCL